MVQGLQTQFTLHWQLASGLHSAMGGPKRERESIPSTATSSGILTCQLYPTQKVKHQLYGDAQGWGHGCTALNS